VWEQTLGGDEPRLLHEFFERQVLLQPDGVAIECNGETLTYSQLNQFADSIAATLIGHGVGPGSLIALYFKKSCGLFAALLGVLKAGAGYVPLDPGFPLGRIQSILADANISIVLSEGQCGRALEAHVSSKVIFVGEDQTEPSPPLEPVVVVPTDICYVIYTSGSTGRPKGVVIEHRNAVNFVRALRNIYQLNAQDRVYQGFSIAFDASVEEIWAAFSLGGTLVVPNEEIARSTIDAAEFINCRRVTFFSTVPSFLALISTDLPTVRLLVVGGEPCAGELASRWAKPERRMLNTYGPTETAVVATYAECLAGEPVTIGTALPGYVTFVLDDQLRPVKAGQCGELYIGGESVARGYLNRPELTAERFIESPGAEWDLPPGRFYRTYDLVCLTESGSLQFVGRADGQMKIRGFRVELSEIEAVLMEHPSIRAAAVNVIEFGGLKELAAYVVVEKSIDKLDHCGLSQLLRGRVPEYMVPRYLDIVEQLPTLTSSKVDRKLLPPPKTLFSAATRTAVAPATELERAISDVWENLFQFSPISVEDDFFRDLRGHSLLAGQAVTEIRSRLNTVCVSVRDLYEHRTIRQIALHLDRIGIGINSRFASPQRPDNRSSTAEPAQAPLPRTRWICAALQLVSLIAFYAIVSAPLVFAIVLVLKVLGGEWSVGQAVQLATIVGFLIWPCSLLLSIAVKWIVIGRYRPGRYPVWGLYYFRWWLVRLFQSLSWSEMFVGTPLMSIYYRAMGGRIGKRCILNTPHCTAFDLVTIDDDTSIGTDTHLLGYRVEDGWLILDRVTIGRECYVGTHCALGLNVTMHDCARLGDMSLLADDTIIETDQTLSGSPAGAAQVDVPDVQSRPERRGRPFLFGLLHLGLIYVMGWILIFASLPALGLIGYALYAFGPAAAVIAAFAAVPVSIVWYLFLVVAIKRIAIGRITPGIHSVHSAYFLRYWFLNYLLNNTRSLVLPIYATLYLPKFLRLLGAKIGRRVEISTVMRIIPELLEIDEGSFLADACIVGGQRIYRGFVEVRANRIGSRTFVGNSALVPGGVDIADNGLIGVMSIPPPGLARTPAGTRWLGSPAFQLPRTEQFSCFSDRQTFAPSYGLICLRASIDLLRILLPGLLFAAALVLFCLAIAQAYYALPMGLVAVLAPCIALLMSLLTIAVVAFFKNLLIGGYEPTIKPLWCTYVWLNEVVNGLYETNAASAMAPLMGTPFISTCLRLMGCKIGRWVFLESTLFSEFDLVEIGDRASINFGATVQTHLFEDRVMKADHLRIGEGCSVGNMSVVLYGTEMQKGSSLGPLSVLMKGEILPAFSRWFGIPTQPTAARAVEQGCPAGRASSSIEAMRSYAPELIAAAPT
jgi:non-ribosomal peptide synthetase-like protein